MNLYSTDFYRLASKRLNQDGLFAQWLPIATQNDEGHTRAGAQLSDAFPHATLWTTEMHEMLLIGSNSKIELNATEITRRFAHPNVSTALQAVGISSPAALLATWVTGREGLGRYAASVRPVTDDNPSIEYAAWVKPKEIVQVLPVQAEPPLVGADDAFREEISRQRKSLLDFYAVGIAAFNGDREGWGQARQCTAL